jgi:acyl-CoA synthetase (AMP-forming)/AMP-acid ligase II
MSFFSPFPPIEVPDVSVYDYLFGDMADGTADRIALVDAAAGIKLSFSELKACIDAFAGAIAERGIGVGDVVGVLAPNGWAFAVAFHGILYAGATATPISTLFTVNEIAKQLRDSNARLLITVSKLLSQAEEAVVAVGLSVAEVGVLDGEDVGNPKGNGRSHFAKLVAPGGDHPRYTPKVGFDPATHVAALPYSSGTTGAPKGVMLTHRNLVANVAQLQQMSRSGPHEVLIAVVPLFHSYGTALLNMALRGRTRLVVMAAFDLQEFLSNVRTHRCTQAYIAPPVAVALAKDRLVDSFDLLSLHTITSAAAPLDEQLATAVTRRLGSRVLQGYGMTELSPASHMIPHDGGLRSVGSMAPLSSCGWTVANSESKIIDPDSGVEIPLPATGLSEPGELCFKGPNVMLGYLNNDEATAATIDRAGFLHTGDLARVDADGCVYIVDRLKELIKYKGYQVAPAELEALLLTHPGIADAAVVGVTDQRSGEEIPKAFVVRQSDSQITENEIMDFVAAQVAPYKKIRQVQFIDMVPKSPAGKILRKTLRSTAAPPNP